MRAAVVTAFDGPVAIVERTAPTGRPGRTIVEVRAATVAHLDHTIWRGRFLRPPSLPYVPGVEAAGVVVESDSFAVGQRVWVRGGGLGTVTDGTWCEVVDAPSAACGVLPDAVSFAVGASFFSPATSAWVSLNDVGCVLPGQRVLVTGASGAVGASAVQLAHALGAHVTGSVSSPQRVAHVPTVCDVVVVNDQMHASAFGDQLFDVVIDTVGGPGAPALLTRVVAGGCMVVVGYLAGTAMELDLAQFCQRDVSLLPLNMVRREAAGRAAAPELLRRIADGQLQLSVTEMAFDDVAVAFDRLVSRPVGRLVLTMHPNT
jgi:NADPH:quinone reductase